jgi:hypothetical protein
MTKPLLLCVLAAAVALSSGCGMFSHKRPKESSAIAADTEESLHKRYVEKRVAELTAQGKTPDVARSDAEAEFRERYAFALPTKK